MNGGAAYREITITTDASGAGTAISRPISGFLHSILYRPAASGPMTGGTITVTDSYHGGTIATVPVPASGGTVQRPVATTVDSSGAASTSLTRFSVTAGLTATVAGGGASKSGTVRFVYSDYS